MNVNMRYGSPGDGSKYQSKVQNMLVVERVSIGSGTLSATTGTSVSASISKTGYKPLGIVGIYKGGQNYATVSVSGFYIESETAYVSIFNPNSASRTYSISADILYIQNKEG